MRKTFVYKARMTEAVATKAEQQLALCCELYNAALQERRDAYKMCGITVGANEQKKQLPLIKEIRPEYRAIGSQVLQDVIERLDKGFKAFFRRVQSGEKPGYPRFKSVRRYASITFKQVGWKLVSDKQLWLQGIGNVRLHISKKTYRIQGTVKTVTLRRDKCNDWWICFSCENVPTREEQLAYTGDIVGIDLGLQAFIATSAGDKVANPRYLHISEAANKRAARKIARRKKGGARRRKAALTLARKHRKVTRARLNFHHKTALDLIKRYDVIGVEALNIKGLSRGFHAKSFSDVGWGQFLQILSYKAAEAGREIIRVNPKNTSQECSGCGDLPEKKKTLSVRIHECSICGLVEDRDINAAGNILWRTLNVLCPAEKREGCEGEKLTVKRGRACPSGSRPASKAAAKI